MLQQELTSLLAAADFLEENGMQQCKTLRDAVKVLEFVRGGGSISLERSLLDIERGPAECVSVRRGNLQRQRRADHPEKFDLAMLAATVDEVEEEGRRILMGYPVVEVHGIVPESEIVLGDWSNRRFTR